MTITRTSGCETSFAPRTSALVDHLDLWSSIAILRHGGTLDIRYLTRGSSLGARIGEWLLRRYGHQLKPISSPLLERPFTGYFVEFIDRMNRYGLQNIEISINRALERVEFCNELERLRTARFLLLANTRIIKRHVEVLEAARLLGEQGVHVIAFLQSGPLNRNAISFMADASVSVNCYSAPFRIRLVRRPESKVHEADPWAGEATLRHLARFAAALFLCTFGFLLSLLRVRKTDIRYDIIALTSRSEPTARIDDLYWLDALRRRSDARVALICTSPLSDACRAYYAGRVESSCDTRQLTRPSSICGGQWTRIRGRHLAGMLRSAANAARAIFRHRLPISYVAALLSLWERTALYQALMMETGAHIGWAMTEGHELNTQAIANAAARTGRIVAGTTWSIWDTPHINSSFNRNDVMFVWGARQARLFEASGAISSRYVLTGYPTMRIATNDASARHIVDRWRAADPDATVLCFYDNAGADDFPVSLSEVQAIYDCVIEAVERRAGLRLLLKTKRPDLLPLPDTLIARIEKLVADGRATVHDLYGDAGSGIAAHAVIGISVASLGLIAAHRGRTCILYDRENILQRYPVEGLHDLRVVHSVTELGETLASLENGSGEFAAPPIRPDDVDAWTDDNADERTACYLAALVAAGKDGMARSEMISAADRAYASSYGSGHIIVSGGQAETGTPVEANLPLGPDPKVS